jgi:hypothetical protein
MTTMNPPWKNNKKYKEFDDKERLGEVANGCVGYVAADLSALVQRTTTSGSKRLWGGRPALQAAVIAIPG